MNEATVVAESPMPAPAASGWAQTLARHLVLRKLQTIREGSLRLVDGGEHLFGNDGGDPALSATVTVLDTSLYLDIARGGTIGAAEAYMLGKWETDDLTRVIRVLVRNVDVMDGMERGTASLMGIVQRLYHRLHENSRRGARLNIAAHYDLGNEFFSQFLDETMMYSSAVFERDDMTLREASVAKLDRICRKLDLKPSDRVLEIGTGWGGFAIHAAARYGCHVTTTTISRQQYEYARARVRDAGLEERVTVLLKDYRDLAGSYDKLVSIEMIEAVGQSFLDTYFRRCSELLKPNGMFALQAITIADQRYDQALKAVDFIQRYIFPGGSLPSVSVIARKVAEASDMRIFHLEDIGPHYARTLRAWRSRFLAAASTIQSMGFGQDFLRMWNYYFCYCEGGFEERSIGAVQILFTKPGNRREPVLSLASS